MRTQNDPMTSRWIAQKLVKQSVVPQVRDALRRLLQSESEWERASAILAVQAMQAVLAEVPEPTATSDDLFPLGCPFCQAVSEVPSGSLNLWKCARCTWPNLALRNVASSDWGKLMESKAQSKLDAETEKLARKLASLQGPLRMSSNPDEQDTLRKQIRAIGAKLAAQGGILRMLAACYRAASFSGGYLRAIEMSWDRISGWCN